ncbi:unnamed protein product [Ilex paraguariensis]|uniref:Uncharacterized protein n=1 Tax=Ilex paraguariensis TaxID=185542 RepID=A0ABC8TBT4_9AQUA
MNKLNSGGSKPWNMYTTSDPSPSETGGNWDEAPWKKSGTSMNAISIGFVATALLISMFLIMAIFEHLFRPNPSFSSPQDDTNSPMESGTMQKLGNPQTVSMSYVSTISVFMPGQRYPTFIAQPAPLPCTREGVYWPPHEQSIAIT